MLAESHTRPDVQESYSTSTSTSNLRVTTERRTPADMVIAAGMSPHRLGTALLRLMSEWDRSAKPAPMTRAQVEAVSKTFFAEPAGTADNPNPHAGLVREEKAGQVRYRMPLEMAHELASKWHEHELAILMQSLKTLPSVRDALTHWLTAEGVDGAAHIVAPAVMWWLAPICPVCHGVKQRVVRDTGRLSGKPCGGCKGTGERKLPHQGLGRKVLAHIQHCVGVARKDLKGRFKHQKRERGERPEHVVLVGERWRTRAGGLFDIVGQAEDAHPPALVGRSVADPAFTWRFNRGGTTWGTFRQGPNGMDLVERIDGAS